MEMFGSHLEEQGDKGTITILVAKKQLSWVVLAWFPFRGALVNFSNILPAQSTAERQNPHISRGGELSHVLLASGTTNCIQHGSDLRYKQIQFSEFHV